MTQIRLRSLRLRKESPSDPDYESPDGRRIWKRKAGDTIWWDLEGFDGHFYTLGELRRFLAQENAEDSSLDEDPGRRRCPECGLLLASVSGACSTGYCPRYLQVPE